MAEVRATVGGGAGGFNLSFNELIAHVSGQSGRGDAKKGMFQHRNGNILVIYSKNPQLVEIEARRNGRRTNRTGLTRTGMFLIGKKGNARLVTCDRDADGAKDWKEFPGSITLAGNPHVIPTPANLGSQSADETFDDDDDSDED